MEDNKSSLSLRIALSEWSDYCEGKRVFEDCYFYGLFMDINGNDYNALHKIFKYFPNADELLIRTSNYITAKESHINSNKNISNSEDCIKLALLDLNLKNKLLLEAGITSFDEIISNLTPVYVTNLRETINEQNIDLDSEFSSEVNELIQENWIHKPEHQIYQLWEAFFGLTQSLEMVKYIIKPLSSVKIEFKEYFELYKKGGDYFITDKNIFIGSQFYN